MNHGGKGKAVHTRCGYPSCQSELDFLCLEQNPIMIIVSVKMFVPLELSSLYVHRHTSGPR